MNPFWLALRELRRYLLGLLFFVLLGAALRAHLYFAFRELAADTGAQDVFSAFLMGARFDLRMGVYACLPMVFVPLFPRLHRFCWPWVLFFLAAYLLAGIAEVEFYRAFQQRLNNLVFEYFKHEPATVVRMLVDSYPIGTLLGAWAASTLALAALVRRLLPPAPSPAMALPAWQRLTLCLALLLLGVAAARGTLRTGPPLRWGDAFEHHNMFLNHLGQNGSYTLAMAAIKELSGRERSEWLAVMDQPTATGITRQLLLRADETLVDADRAAVRRHSPGMAGTERPRNLVIILMESFSGQFVGALGHDYGATPELDSLARRGTLFTRFLSAGTHTHQGMFATLACFPNLPGFEYLMQTPQAQHQFSGVTRLLPDHASVFLYNGDFAWDNQNGFFRNQGMQRFIGRNDYVNPRLLDRVWGVSDEDMFQRGADEILAMPRDKPFIAVLQSLSNHIPYRFPEPLAFERITDQGEFSDRLTAIKYTDWALGQFFRRIEKDPVYDDTLFAILGDHGVATPHQLTEVNLTRFHIPLLLIGKGVPVGRIDRVASQVDLVPTLVGRMRESFRHQCWGRDQFSLPAADRGFAVIKPSGSEPTVALVRDDLILTHAPGGTKRLYRWSLEGTPAAQSLNDAATATRLERELKAYVQTAMNSLYTNTTAD